MIRHPSCTLWWVLTFVIYSSAVSKEPEFAHVGGVSTSISPTKIPSQGPTSSLSPTATAKPSSKFSNLPSVIPLKSFGPTLIPTTTRTPSKRPTCSPTKSFSTQPTVTSSKIPSVQPSTAPKIPPAVTSTYYDVDAATHQTYFNYFANNGYRMISLSAYGDPSAAKYAAVWVKRIGNGWVAVHNTNSIGFQNFYNTYTANTKNFVPVIISVTGTTTANAIFAAVFELNAASSLLLYYGMNSAQFASNNANALSQNLYLVSLTIYGTPSARLYAAIWHGNSVYTKWHVHAADSAAAFAVTFAQETQLPGVTPNAYRPALIAISSDQTYASVFKDNYVGPWTAYYGLSAAALQAQLNQQSAAGYYPISLQGGGIGSGTVFAVIFAAQDIPSPRVFTATGPVAAFVNVAPFDNLMKSFMVANGVRAAQLAIAVNGVNSLSRAYTWAESAYRQTQPSDTFLLASLSKIFLEAAVQSLYDSNRIHTYSLVYPLLGFSNPADTRSNSITIQQLLDHQGGYDDSSSGSGFDPTYNMRYIAQRLQLGRPANKLDIATYMYKNYVLDFTPGTNTAYSNYGYLLASAVVEKVTGMDYFAYVKQATLTPLGITEVAVSSTLASGRPVTQAITEDQGLAYNALYVTTDVISPSVYGGDGEIKEVGAGCAGIAASAQAMVQFIHVNKVWGNGPRSAYSGNFELERTGSTPGSSTMAASRSGGIDWAFNINTRDWPANVPQNANLGYLGAEIDNLITSANL